MYMIQSTNNYLGRLALALAVGLVVLGVAFLLACSNGQDTQPTEEPQPTATPTVAVTSTQPTATPTVAGTSTQPTQESPLITAVPTSTSAATALPSSPPLQVVATSNIVADWAEVIGGDRIEVFSMVPPGSDPHSFMPGARDVAKVEDADLVLSVGLGLEVDWLEDLVRNASADESRIFALGDGVDPLEFSGDAHDDHMDEEGEDHGGMLIGRLLVADGVEAHLSVIDLSTDDVDSGIFEVAAPNATVYSSPTHRYGIVLARGPEDGDDRIHVFDGGVFHVPHGDHYDLISEPVSRHALEIVEEWPVHYTNSRGWTTIFADTNGHVVLINEKDLVSSQGDYEPIVLEGGFQHGAAFVIADDHVILSSNNPACTEFISGTWDCLPLGVEVRTFDNEVVYDATDRACQYVHGESHNAYGAVFGCIDGVLFVRAHDGQYEHEFIPYPPETGGELALGQFYGHHHSDNFFAPATLFPDGQCCALGGVWLVDVLNGEMREVFPDPSASAAFSSDGETFYMLAADGVLRAFDAHDGGLIGTTQLVDPFDIVFGSPSPAIVVVAEMLYVSDPNSGHVLAVHLEHMEIEEEWEVGGAPSSLAFVGVADSSGAPDEGHDDHQDEGNDGHEEHDHGPLDPHFWFDPNRVKIAISDIAAQLSALDPEGASFYLQNAADYAVQLDGLHSWIQEQVELVRPERRLLVTSHDTFAYFADVYGFEVIGTLIPSLAPDVEPSAEHLTGLVEVIREHNAPAVFSETTVSGKLPEALARETGAAFFQLYADSLGEKGSGAGTYLSMMRTNVERMVEALK